MLCLQPATVAWTQLICLALPTGCNPWWHPGTVKKSRDRLALVSGVNNSQVTTTTPSPHCSVFPHVPPPNKVLSTHAGSSLPASQEQNDLIQAKKGRVTPAKTPSSWTQWTGVNNNLAAVKAAPVCTRRRVGALRDQKLASRLRMSPVARGSRQDPGFQLCQDASRRFDRASQKLFQTISFAEPIRRTRTRSSVTHCALILPGSACKQALLWSPMDSDKHRFLRQADLRPGCGEAEQLQCSLVKAATQATRSGDLRSRVTQSFRWGPDNGPLQC